MIESRIAGIKAGHTVITPTCRSNRGTMGAFEEAVLRLRKLYEEYQCEANAEADWHLVLTVDRPRERKSA